MRKYIYVLLTLVACNSFAQFPDQASKEQSSRETLPVALGYYQSTENLFFSYDAELMQEVHIDFPYQNYSLADFLQKLESERPVEVTQVDTAYYTLSTREFIYKLSLKDSADLQPVPVENVAVLVNQRPVKTEILEKQVRFSYKPQSGDTVTVFALGYENSSLPLKVLMNTTEISLLASPQVIRLHGVTIRDYVTSGINLNPSDQSIAISVADLPLLPGETDGDLFSSLAALPGITTPDNRAGNLYIRGSSTDQSLILFDDIPIYHRGHYYGTISPYNPKMVEEVKVYRNGYHPRMGGRVGGAVEINSGDGSGTEPTVGVGSNTLYGIGYAKLPLGSGKIGLAIGGRKSYPVSFNSPKLSSISDMVFGATAVIDSTGNFAEGFSVDFEDYNARLIFQPTPENQISLSSIYARSTIFYELREPEKAGFENVGVNLKWNTQLSEKWDSELSVTTSHYFYNFLIGEAIEEHGPGLPGTYSENTIDDIGVVQEFSLETGRNNRLQSGIEYNWKNVSFGSKSINRRDSSQIIFREERVDAHILSPFINYEWNNLDRLYLQLGIRANYYSVLNDFRPEPRLFVNYDLSKATLIKGSAGFYNQYLSQVKNLEFTGGGFDNEVWILADESSEIINGTQFMMGGLWTLRKWVIDLEGYYKTADNVTQYSGRKFTENGFWLSRDIDMYGVDFFLKAQVNPAVSLWAGYTFSEVKLTMDTALDVSYDDKFSQPHVFYAGGSFSKGNFKVSGGWRYASGLYAYSLDIIEVERGFARNRPPGGPQGPLQTNPFADIPERYPSVHFLDASASYSIPRTKKWPLATTFGVSVVNFYDQNNLTDKVIRLVNGLPSFVSRPAMRFAPNVMVLVEW